MENMKKNRLFQLALLVMASMPTAAQQQVYSSFLHEGKTWKLQQVVAYTTSEVTVTVAGDTIAGGKSCKKLILNDGGEKSLFSVMVEEGEKVYEYNGERFVPVYDFGLREGDTIRDGNDAIVVAATDTVDYNGKSFRRLLLHKTNGYTPESSANEFYEYWVEGIGSEYAPNQSYSFGTPGNRYRLLAVDDNGETLMDADGRQKLFPPVLTGISPTTLPCRRANDAAFDLSGRKIQHPQPHQPYIRGGKKYIGK